jgi:peptide deformylase
MPLRIIQYPHPTLRRRSKPLKRVDAELRSIVRSMFELMYEAKGVGLAANQVNLPYRLFVLNLTGDAALSDQEQVFINPVLSRQKGTAEAEEGCLSLPGLYAEVMRPETVRINAYSLDGEELTIDAADMLARVVQHETDHLDGMLFIDRLSETQRMAVKDALAEFESEFDSQRRRGEIPADEQILAELADLESLRT